jgi:hypothetical protein
VSLILFRIPLPFRYSGFCDKSNCVILFEFDRRRAGSVYRVVRFLSLRYISCESKIFANTSNSLKDR